MAEWKKVECALTFLKTNHPWMKIKLLRRWTRWIKGHKLDKIKVTHSLIFAVIMFLGSHAYSFMSATSRSLQRRFQVFTNHSSSHGEPQVCCWYVVSQVGGLHWLTFYFCLHECVLCVSFRLYLFGLFLWWGMDFDFYCQSVVSQSSNCVIDNNVIRWKM